jgi:hypothetical protein
MGDRPLEAGTYRVGFLLPLAVTVTVPEGWSAFEDWALLNQASHGGTAVSFYRVVNLYEDPCHWQDAEMDPPVGQTVQDLVDAMAGFAERDPSEPQPETISGFSGQVIEWRVPTDTKFAECDSDQYRSWTKSNWRADDFGVRFHQLPGQVDRIHALDVGGTRLVIDQNWIASAGDDARQELQTIVDSITIAPPN